MEFKHIPVLLNEVIEGLNISPSGIYIDCTIGGAGHAGEIVKKLNSKGILIGFDKDDDAVNASYDRLKDVANVFIFNPIKEEKPINFLNALKKPNKPTCLIVKSDFKKSPEILANLGFNKIDGMLIDLGVSSYQIDTPERGFSFRSDAPLDMRMDRTQFFTAKEIVNTYSEEALADLFFKYGEEEFSKSIAKNIVKVRNEKEIETTAQLNQIVENSMPKKIVFSRGGAAKKVFQALRIEVNSELFGLDELIKKLVDLLSKEGRFCVISFHSLEDRIVKNAFKELATDCICPPSFPKCICNHKAEIKLISKKPITSNDKELKLNSRASCAKLRIAQRN